VGRDLGAGLDLGVGDGLGVDVGVGVEVGIGVAVAVGVVVGVGVAVAVAVAIGVLVGVGVGVSLGDNTRYLESLGMPLVKTVTNAGPKGKSKAVEVKELSDHPAMGSTGRKETSLLSMLRSCTNG